MMVLDWASEIDGRKSRRAVAIFGLGLIGDEIRRALDFYHTPRSVSLPFDWNLDAGQRRAQMEAINRHISGLLGPNDKDLQVDVVWAAGRGGFGANAGSLESEHDVFLQSIEFARGFRKAEVRYHLVSSAGGLFEGQRHVGKDGVPDPRRPYGLAKINQENAVLSQLPELTSAIYRPSSVYGYRGRKGRVGLVVALIDSAIRYRAAEIFGLPGTMRDFVFADDVGRFIAQKISSQLAVSSKYLLACGRPTTVIEMVAIVENVIGRRLSLNFKAAGDNASHNTFRPSALPQDWHPIAIEIGVSIVAKRMIADFFGGFTA